MNAPYIAETSGLTKRFGKRVPSRTSACFPAFLGFFVWMASRGVVLLRRREREELVPAATV